MRPTVNQAFQTGHLWRRDVVLCSFSLPSSLSFSRGILRRFVFRLFPPSLLFTLLKDPIPSSLSSSLSWNVHVYIRREEKGMGAWNRYMEEWKREGELRKIERGRERRRFHRWKRHDHDGYEVPRADVVRSYSWERGWPPLRHSSGVRRFEWRPPAIQKINLSSRTFPIYGPRLLAEVMNPHRLRLVYYGLAGNRSNILLSTLAPRKTIPTVLPSTILVYHRLPNLILIVLSLWKFHRRVDVCVEILSKLDRAFRFFANFGNLLFSFGNLPMIPPITLFSPNYSQF